MADDLRTTVDDVWKRMSAGERILFIDARNPQAWGQSDVQLPGAMRVPADHPERYLNIIPQDRPIVVYCT